ncbi:MAG: zinc ribbon domain-containing protein [Clostridia bacterium]|nr:zinc ribbon domain-containing protein [Clostridia bacterium]
MYCVKCGVNLADTEKICPLCGTRVYHPEIEQGAGEDLYPKQKYPKSRKSSYLSQIFLTFAVVLAMVIVFLCDIKIMGAITWSGYVIGGLLIGYIFVILPSWFNRPNPVIFVPVDFAAVGVFLLYINLYTNGGWFLSFAFPVVGGIGILVTVLTVLLKYLPKGKLFVIGGFFILLGAFMMLAEFMMIITFKVGRFLGWSIYPLVSLGMIGAFLIFLAIYRPARELMERKFFI